MSIKLRIDLCSFILKINKLVQFFNLQLIEKFLRRREEYGGFYDRLSNSLTEIHNALKEIRKIRLGKRGRIGRLLIKLGVGLIAFPEPVISDAIGTGLVVGGTIVNEIEERRSIHSICNKWLNSLREFNEAMKEVMRKSYLPRF